MFRLVAASLVLAMACGCAAQRGRLDAGDKLAARHDDSRGDRHARISSRTDARVQSYLAVTDSGVAPVQRSTLLGGMGLDPLALQLPRSGWPAAVRDYSGGEASAYSELFLDVQYGNDGSGGWGGWGGSSGYTYRQIRSVRAGSAAR